MVSSLKVTRVGNSLGVILPIEILALLDVQKGDRMFLVETPDGFTLTPYDPKIQKELDTIGNIMGTGRATQEKGKAKKSENFSD